MRHEIHRLQIAAPTAVSTEVKQAAEDLKHHQGANPAAPRWRT